MEDDADDALLGTLRPLRTGERRVNAGDALTGVYANEPIYWGLLTSALAYVIVSLATKPTPAEVLHKWEERKAGNFNEDEVVVVQPTGH